MFRIIVLLFLSGCVVKNSDFKVGEIVGFESEKVTQFLKQYSKPDCKNTISASYEIKDGSLITLENNNSLFDLLTVEIKLKCVRDDKTERSKDFVFMWRNLCEEKWQYDQRFFYMIANKIMQKGKLLC